MCSSDLPGPGLPGLVQHLQHEWVILANLLCLLMGFALLSRHFEESKVPAVLPKYLADDWKGCFTLLVMVFVLSSFLDNAPTYLTFLALGQGQHLASEVAGVPHTVLEAISLGAVFMGANTYIGNGPNFMVKAIVFVTVMMWVRWTLPRLRIDQVMTTCLKYCVPLGALCFAGVAGWQSLGLWSPNDIRPQPLRSSVREFDLPAEFAPGQTGQVKADPVKSSPSQPAVASEVDRKGASRFAIAGDAKETRGGAQ